MHWPSSAAEADAVLPAGQPSGWRRDRLPPRLRPERPRSHLRPHLPPEHRPLRVCYIGSEFGDKPVGHLLVALVSATNEAAAAGGEAGNGLISFVYQLAAEPALPALQALLGSGTLSPKRCIHSDVPLYNSLVIIHTKYTGVRQNDCNVYA